MLKLSKQIPAKTKTITANWCRKDLMEMSEQFRAIRSKSTNPMNKCYWCKHPFENGEMMALASFNKIGNRTLCQGYANELLANESTP